VDVTASFVKVLPSGKYLIKCKNNTKDGFFRKVSFAVVIRSADGEFLEYSTDSVSYINPGTTVYGYYIPDEEYDVDLTKCTFEIDSFDIEVSKYIKYTDCSSKIQITDPKKGQITASDESIDIKLKNNSSEVARINYTILWYDKAKKVVAVEDMFYGDMSKKGVNKITIYTPDAKYGAVSYKIVIRAFNEVNISTSNPDFFIPEF